MVCARPSMLSSSVDADMVKGWRGKRRPAREVTRQDPGSGQTRGPAIDAPVDHDGAYFLDEVKNQAATLWTDWRLVNASI